MAEILQNVGNAITRLSMDWFDETSVVASHHVPDMSAMMRLPWQWLLPSNSALNINQLWASGAECMNQFWWNLAQDSKLGPQWQSRNQILKFLKFKMAGGRHVGEYWKCHNSLTNGPIGTKLGWSHPITLPTCLSCFGCRWQSTLHWVRSSFAKSKG